MTITVLAEAEVSFMVSCPDLFTAPSHLEMVKGLLAHTDAHYLIMSCNLINSSVAMTQKVKCGQDFTRKQQQNYQWS